MMVIVPVKAGDRSGFICAGEERSGFVIFEPVSEVEPTEEELEFSEWLVEALIDGMEA